MTFQEVCSENERRSFGTKFAFEQRAIVLRNKLNVLSWSSLVVPVIVGTLLSSFNDVELAGYAKLASGLLGGLLACVGLWAVVAGWTDTLSKSERAMLSNITLQNEWHELSKYVGIDASSRLRELQIKHNAQEQEDVLAKFTAFEIKRMMRATLIQYQQQCVSCNELPKSIEPKNSSCSVCGMP